MHPLMGSTFRAPSAAEYRAIAVAVEPAPSVRLRSLKFSTPELFNSAPLSEAVPVYRKPFSVILEASVGISLASVPRPQRVEGRAGGINAPVPDISSTSA